MKITDIINKNYFTNMIKIVYFDFGAVIVNYEKVFSKICNDFSIDIKDFWNLYSQFDADLAIGKVSTEQFWQECIRKYSLGNTESYDLVGNWVSDYKIIQPINDLIYSLKNKVDVGIISNICDGLWEKSFELGFIPKIKYKKIYLSYQEKMAKPNLDIYEIVQRESGVLPNEILFVDDKAENMIVPKSLGWQTVLFDEAKAAEGVSKIREFIT
jgi:FMN phosphatase YigB (HAD superfamily)